MLALFTSRTFEYQRLSASAGKAVFFYLKIYLKICRTDLSHRSIRVMPSCWFFVSFSLAFYELFVSFL